MANLMTFFASLMVLELTQRLLASKDTLFIGCNAVAYSVDVRQLYLEDSGLMSI